MNTNIETRRTHCCRKSLAHLCMASTAAFVLFGSAGAFAQTALDTASFTIPADVRTPTTDLTIEKFENFGGFKVVLTSNGPDAVAGIIVTDKVVGGRACPASNPVTITGSGVPAGDFTIANLTSSGISLGSLSSGQSATLSFSCQVK